jgi:hypothetical protein
MPGVARGIAGAAAVLVLAACSGELARDPCAGVECSSRGFCIDDQGTAYCVCISGFHPAAGLECVANDPTDPCRDVDCSGHGRCRVAGDDITCDCDPGYRHLEGACGAAECDLQCVPAEPPDGGPDRPDDGATDDVDGRDTDEDRGTEDGAEAPPEGGADADEDGGDAPGEEVGAEDADGEAAGPGIAVDPTGGLTTTEGGGAAAFTIVLRSVPAADVTLDLSSSDTTEGVVLPSFVAFTPLDWGVPRTATVTGQDDDVADGSQAYTVRIAPAVSADPDYLGLDAPDVAATNLDNDRVGVTVDPTSGLVTTEGGGSAAFTVVLDSEPTADVVIDFSSSDTSEGTVAPARLTFTPAAWGAPRVVTVTGRDDLVADGDQAYAVVASPTASADPNYDSLAVPSVDVVNHDDDGPGFIVDPTAGLTTTESGGAAAFTIVLTSEPTADVTVGLSSSDDTEGTVNPIDVTFSAANWDDPRMVRVEGVDDVAVDGDVPYQIITYPAASADPAYGGRNPPDVAVINMDDD